VRGNLLGLVILAGVFYGGYWVGKKTCVTGGR
jgi:hypothetical protein